VHFPESSIPLQQPALFEERSPSPRSRAFWSSSRESFPTRGWLLFFLFSWRWLVLFFCYPLTFRQKKPSISWTFPSQTAFASLYSAPARKLPVVSLSALLDGSWAFFPHSSSGASDSITRCTHFFLFFGWRPVVCSKKRRRCPTDLLKRPLRQRDWPILLQFLLVLFTLPRAETFLPWYPPPRHTVSHPPLSLYGLA